MASMEEIQGILKGGGIGVLATDTIYGVVGSALHAPSVERIYELKGRDEDKPFIILIPSIDSLKQFAIPLSEPARKVLDGCWPGPTSVILPAPSNELQYLHRGKKSLAFRLPNVERLIKILQVTGPLVAPSANPQGRTPAATIDEARAYFGERVDFYDDQGAISGNPSRIISLAEDGSVTVIR